MARPLKGQIKVRQTTRGESFGVAFRLRGEPHYVHFGGSWEGWSLGRAEVERDFLIEKVNRGEWTPAPRTQPAPALAPPASTPQPARSREPAVGPELSDAGVAAKAAEEEGQA